MKTLIVYATNSGATELASQVVEQTLTEHGAEVTRKEVSQTKPDEFGEYDLVVLASPSWDFEDKEGWPHEDYLPFMEEAKQKAFEGKKFAVLGLGDSSYTHFCGAVEHLEELVTAMKGTKVTDSMKIDGFYFNQEEHSQKIKDWATQVATSAAS